MQLLKRLFDFYVFGNVHVGLSCCCLTKVTLYFFEISNNILPLFVFFATVLSYNFIRMYRKAEIRSWIYDWIALNKLLIYIISMISLLGVIYFGLQLEKNTIMVLLPLGILTLFYVVPLRNKITLRKIPGFKLLLIALSWATVTVILPAINYEISLTKEVMIVFFQRVLFIMAITIPFDVRDLNSDDITLKTMPQFFGIARAKRMGIFFLMLFLGLNFMKYTSPQIFKIDLIVAVISLFFLVKATPHQNKYYSAFFVEAIPILWFLLFTLQSPFPS